MGIKTWPGNWAFLFVGLNPDYFDCRNDIENSNAVIDDPISSFQEVQSKYKPQ